MEGTKKLYRSREDRMIFGLCGGLGDYFSVDANLVRVIFILVSMAGGAGIIAYLLMSLIVPLEPGNENTAFKDEVREFAHKVREETKGVAGGIKEERRKRPGFGAGVFFGLILIAVGVGLIFQQFSPFYHMYFQVFWPLLIILLGVYFTVRKRER